MDPAHWLAPAGIAVLTATLLRKTRRRGRPAAKPAAPRSAGDAVRETVNGWELRLHDAGRAAEASLQTRIAELRAVERSAPEVPPEPGDDATRCHLRQAGYDEGEIDILLGPGVEEARRTA